MKKLSAMQRLIRFCFAGLLASVAGCVYQDDMSGIKDTRAARAHTSIDPSIDIAPDGNSLVFVGNGKGGSDLYRYTFATRRVTPLVQTDEQEIYPAFSPDGRYLTYSCGKGDFDADGWIYPRHLYVLDLQNDQVRQLTNDPDRWDYSPHFSPDGKTIAFHGAARDTRTKYPSDVWTADVATGNCQQLTKEEYDIMPRPVFWHNGKDVLFAAYKNREDEKKSYLASVAVQNPGAPQPITPTGINSSSGQVVDANTLLLMSDLDGSLTHKVCVFDVPTQKFDVLADVPTGPSSPVVNGRTVYWLQGKGILMRIDLDTRKAEQIEDETLLSHPERYY